jgi:hypothetical protein
MLLAAFRHFQLYDAGPRRAALPSLALPLLVRFGGAVLTDFLCIFPQPQSLFDVWRILRDNCDMSVDPKTISLSDAQRRVLAELSDKSGKPWPEVFTEALSTYRPKPATNGNAAESFSAAAERPGLVGCVEGPADLSTNANYMEGFGERGK